MNKTDIAKFLLLRTIGNFLVLFTLFGFFATFGPALYYEATYRIGTVRGIRYALAEVENKVQKKNSHTGQNPSLLAALLSQETEHVLVPSSTHFSLVIPKIGANHKVFENVDPTDGKEYLPILERGIAHAQGTAFPGMDGTIYLFAHSTDSFWNVGRYNAVFYLLKELEVGDPISVFFMDRRYNYVVSDKKIADPSYVEYLSSNIGKGEVLVLQTCWPPGTTWKRLFVFAKPKT